MNNHTEVAHEEKLTIKQAAAFIAEHKVHPNTIRNWIYDGIYHNGTIIQLDAVKLGGRLYTSKEALQRFIERTNT